MVYILFAVGLLLLIVGAEVLVRGASRLAASLGVTQLVIGLTVVAFGTSSPELAVSVQSALEGQAGADIAIGNVVGSNIFNVLFILGLSAVITPLVVAGKLIRLDVPLMIGLSVLLLLLGLDGTLGRVEGLVLVGGIVAYTAFALVQGRASGTTDTEARPENEPRGENETADDGRRSKGIDVLLVVVGLAMLVVGSRWLVNGAVTMAESLGISQLVIGLTIVSAGTSLPEVATSIMASLRGRRDIAVGNVVGSNIFNILAVLGLSSVVAPSGVAVSPAALTFDIPVMIAAAVVCLPIFFTGYRIGRLEGALFLGYYAAYVIYLVLAASAHDALSTFSAFILYVTIPATLLILFLAVYREAVRHRSPVNGPE